VLIVPAVLAAALAVAPGCAVTDATLTWGFKESFRAYIDGSIANGEWTVSNGAVYATPSFSWPGGTGRYDPATGTGYIDFTGSVRFTGHDGVLDTTIENPTLVLDGATGTLWLDVTGVTMDGAMVDTDDVPFVALSSVEVTGEDAARTLDAGTALTEDGAAAFPNYPAGEAFDPVAVSMTVGKTCAAETPDAGYAPQGAQFPLAGFLTALGGLTVIAAATVFFLLTRRRRA
jgi:hypothetical protein